MQYAKTHAGERITATKDVEGLCPGCKSPLMAKALQSKHVVPHWAHRAGDCDPWYEPESEWHRGWKERWPVECREVVIGPHRADVRQKDGKVIELQHSPISSSEIAERENFYGNMMWLLDARTWDIGDRDVSFAGSEDYGSESYDRWEVSFSPLRSMRLADKQQIKATWRRPKSSWSVATKTIVLDIAPGCLVRVHRMNWGVRVGCFVAGQVSIYDAEAYATHLKDVWARMQAAIEKARREEAEETARINELVKAGKMSAPWSPMTVPNEGLGPKEGG